MSREVIREAATVEEALDAALEDLGVQQNAVEYEVEEEPGRKLFGLGSERLARVRVWLKPDAEAEIDAARRAAHEILDTAAPDEAVPEHAITPTLAEEELDRIADEAVSAIQSFLEGFGITAEIEEYEGDEGEIILDIVGDDLGVLIGRHGRTLDALQVLVSAITNRQTGLRYPVIVDVSGYRYRRREQLEDIARRAADRASKQKSAVRLRPMNSYERRIVHVFLREDKRVTTTSEGEDPSRAIVVLPR